MKKHDEHEETPDVEAKQHSKTFLKKALQAKRHGAQRPKRHGGAKRTKSKASKRMAK